MSSISSIKDNKSSVINPISNSSSATCPSMRSEIQSAARSVKNAVKSFFKSIANRVNTAIFHLERASATQRSTEIQKNLDKRKNEVCLNQQQAHVIEPLSNLLGDDLNEFTQTPLDIIILGMVQAIANTNPEKVLESLENKLVKAAKTLKDDANDVMHNMESLATQGATSIQDRLNAPPAPTQDEQEQERTISELTELQQLRGLPEEDPALLKANNDARKAKKILKIIKLNPKHKAVLLQKWPIDALDRELDALTHLPGVLDKRYKIVSNVFNSSDAIISNDLPQYQSNPKTAAEAAEYINEILKLDPTQSVPNLKQMELEALLTVLRRCRTQAPGKKGVCERSATLEAFPLTQNDEERAYRAALAQKVWSQDPTQSLTELLKMNGSELSSLSTSIQNTQFRAEIEKIQAQDAQERQVLIQGIKRDHRTITNDFSWELSNADRFTLEELREFATATSKACESHQHRKAAVGQIKERQFWIEKIQKHNSALTVNHFEDLTIIELQALAQQLANIDHKQ